jgi:hypothetical protein
LNLKWTWTNSYDGGIVMNIGWNLIKIEGGSAEA